jgi:hypothetical protein
MQYWLITMDLFCDEYRTGTSTPYCSTLTEVSHGFHQFVFGGKFADGRRFASGDDQTIEIREVGGQSHFASLDTNPLEHMYVFGEIALKG